MGNKKLGVLGIFLFLIIGFIFIINSSVVKNVSGIDEIGCYPDNCVPYSTGYCGVWDPSHSFCCCATCEKLCDVGDKKCDGDFGFKTCESISGTSCSNWGSTTFCDKGQVCNNGNCCTPSCSGKICGSDGCGGSCSPGCDSGEYCSGGTCVTCTQTLCGNSCVDLQTNKDNCGGCGNHCGGTQICCGGECFNLQINRDNCGSCGHACSGDQVCYKGSCCTPDCLGKECGSDGCGGTCGTCGTLSDSNICSNGQCHNAICHVTNVSTSNDTLVMGLSGLSNAHGELASEDNYNYGLYCNFPGESSSGGILMYLSSSTNAHAEAPDVVHPNYGTEVLYSGFYSCRSTNGSCSTKDSEIDVIHLSSGTNAHIGNTFNDFDNFNRRICCTLNITEPVGTCGDRNCDAGENCTTCPQDCGACSTGPNAYWADTAGNEITQKEFTSNGNKIVNLIIENETGSGSIDLLVSETEGYKDDIADRLIISTLEYAPGKYVGTWTINDTAINWFNKYSGPLNLTFNSTAFPGLTSSSLNLTIITGSDKFCKDYHSKDTCNDHYLQSVADDTVNPMINPEQTCGVDGVSCFCWWNGSSCEGSWSKLSPNCLTNPNAECWIQGKNGYCNNETCKCAAGHPALGNGSCQGEIDCSNQTNDPFGCWIAGDLCGTNCRCMGGTNKSEVIPGTCSFDPESSSLGNCTYVQFGDDNCDDGSLTYNWTATWTWNSKNIFSTKQDCIDIIGKESYCKNDTKRDNKYHYDPFNKNLECKKGGTTVPCPAQIQLGFFDNYNFLTVIVLIFVIYYLWSSKKKKSSNKKKNSKRVKKKK